MSKNHYPKNGTFKVKFANGDEIIFGNNYKPWWQHAVEFIYRRFGSKTEGWRWADVHDIVEKVSFSNQPFYDDGGLKWCGLQAYQELVDKVCKKDKLAPVDVAKIVFVEMPSFKGVLTKKLKEY